MTLSSGMFSGERVVKDIQELSLTEFVKVVEICDGIPLQLFHMKLTDSLQLLLRVRHEATSTPESRRESSRFY